MASIKCTLVEVNLQKVQADVSDGRMPHARGAEGMSTVLKDLASPSLPSAGHLMTWWEVQSKPLEAALSGVTRRWGLSGAGGWGSLLLCNQESRWQGWHSTSSTSTQHGACLRMCSINVCFSGCRAHQRGRLHQPWRLATWALLTKSEFASGISSGSFPGCKPTAWRPWSSMSNTSLANDQSRCSSNPPVSSKAQYKLRG